MHGNGTLQDPLVQRLPWQGVNWTECSVQYMILTYNIIISSPIAVCIIYVLYCVVCVKMLLWEGTYTNLHDCTGNTCATGQGDGKRTHYCCTAAACSRKIKCKLKCVAQLHTSLCWDFSAIAHLTDVAPFSTDVTVECALKADQTDWYTDWQWTRFKCWSGHCQFKGASSNQFKGSIWCTSTYPYTSGRKIVRVGSTVAPKFHSHLSPMYLDPVAKCHIWTYSGKHVKSEHCNIVLQIILSGDVL